MAAELVTRSEGVAEATSLRDDLFAGLETESVSAAVMENRTLAEPVVAHEPRPVQDRATMDGYAFRAADAYPRRVTGAVYPEDDPPGLEEGTAVEIATGAPLPEGADAVLPRERAAITQGHLRGPQVSAGTNVQRRGSSIRAEEQLFAAGRRLAPRDSIVMAELGQESVRVYERPSVGLLATGTEIHEGKQPDRDSGMLMSLMRVWGAAPSAPTTAPDVRGAVRETLVDLAEGHDVILTTGGTSVGKKDHTVSVLAELGTVEVRGVRIRPGRPVTLARLDSFDALALALPGKPFAALAAALIIGRPMFTGQTSLPSVPGTIRQDVAVPESDGELEYLVPVTLDAGDLIPLGHTESALKLYTDRFTPGRVASASRSATADGFVLTRDDLEAPDTVRFVPFSAVEA